MHSITADPSRTDATAKPADSATSRPPQSVLVQIDLQNFDAFVQSCCGVSPYKLDVVGFTHAWLAHHGMEAAGIRIYTGIHDEEREPQKAQSARKRLAWFRAKGASVYAQRVSYQEDSHTKQVRAREKGVDVRLGCEVIEAVTLHGIRNIVVMSQDRDLLSAIDVARSICAAKHWNFEAFTPELRDLSRVEANQRCPTRGLPHTTRLDVPLDLLDKFVSMRKQSELDADQPMDTAEPSTSTTHSASSKPSPMRPR